MGNRPRNLLHHLACDAKPIIPRKNSTNSAHAVFLIIIPPMLALRICLMMVLLASVSRADFQFETPDVHPGLLENSDVHPGLLEDHPLLPDVPATAPAKEAF